MIGTLIKLAIFVAIGLVAYNYMFGTVEEKEQSRQIVNKAKDLGAEAWNLLRSERTKMKEGKYDGALDRLESLYANLQETAIDIQDSEAIEKISKLNDRRREIEESLRGDDDLSTEDQRKLDELTEDTEELMNEMETKSQSGAPY